MALNSVADAYQKTNVETADIVSLVIMCYDAIIRDLEAARKYHAQQNMEAAYAKIRHAQDLLTELLVGLDFDRGGEIAQNLSRIYNFGLRELIGINSQRNSNIYGDLIKIFAELKDAWEEVKKRSPMDVSSSLRSVELPSNHTISI